MHYDFYLLVQTLSLLYDFKDFEEQVMDIGFFDIFSRQLNFFFLFFKILLRERTGGGERGEEEEQAEFMLSMEPNVRLHLTTLR